MAAMRSRLGVLVLIVIALLLASFSFVHNPDQPSFWEDESWMAIGISGTLPEVWTFATDRGVHPPLYFGIAWFYARLAGDGETALRWMGALFTLLGIAIACRFTADRYGWRAGFFAAMLLALSIFLIYMTRLARQYTLFFMLAATMLWAYERWLRAPDKRPGWWWVLVVCQAAGLYTHYFAVWFGFALALHGLIFLPRRVWLRLMAGLVLGGLLFLPWLPSVIAQFSRSSEGLGYATNQLDLVLTNYADRLFNASWWVGGALVLLGIIAARARRSARTTALLLFWTLGTFIPILIINLRFVWYIDRNMLYTLPAVTAFFGLGLAWLSRQRFGWLMAIALMVAYGTAGLSVYQVFWPQTPDWRGAVQRIAVDARPDDTFVFEGEPYSIDYYMRRYLDTRIDFRNMRIWTENPTSGERIWLIDSEFAVNPEAIEAIPESHIQTRRIVWLPIVAELYQRPPESSDVRFGDEIALAYAGPDTLEGRPGDTLMVDVWWRALNPPQTDYASGIQLIGPQGLVAQNDGAFDSGRISAPDLPRDRWVPDARPLDLPANLPAGEYSLVAVVYDWRTGTRLDTDPPAENELYPLAQVRIVEP